MSETIFSKIIKKEIPAEIVFENEEVIGFKDIAPQAKSHFLFIHKEQTSDISDLIQNNPGHLLPLFMAIDEFARKEPTLKNGYRLVTNKGPDSCQTVFHTHFHVLGGEQLGSFGR